MAYVIGVVRRPASRLKGQGSDRFRYTAFLDDGQKAVRVSRFLKNWACVRIPEGGTNKGNPAAITLHGNATSAVRRAMLWNNRGVPARACRIAEEVA